MKLQIKRPSVNTEQVKKTRTKISKQKILTLAGISLLVLAHIILLVAIIMSWRYYNIYPSIFGSVVAILVCIFLIIDIIFFIGFNHSDIALKIITIVLASLLFIGGTVGVAYLHKVNSSIDNVLDDKTNGYETYSGVFVSYKKSFNSLSDLANKNIGMLTETTNGITYIATSLLDKEKIDYAAVQYSNNAELLQALIDGDIDAAVITSGYRKIYENDENSNFSNYLDDMHDFYSFEQELKNDTKKTTKNISKEPFNVLLIGYSRTDIGSPVGLADSIILATINPQTYTVSMMSIARDSFVPITCYGGTYDKINSGRSTSRSCFIETVENFIGMDIDYWMELDYLGLVEIVNTIGGVVIDNPVEFELDGIYVPAGHFLADGQQALQFCRERHHMPNGDFDRQQHQKEVIMAIAKKFIESGDVSLALKAMNAASGDGDESQRFMWTSFTLNELTTIFNLLLNTKNYTSLDTFDLVDFQTLRITGYGGIMYYSMSMRLPLWVYLIYQGSYDESMQHINEVMGNYSTINQKYAFEFSARSPYERPAFYSLEYENKFLYEPDPMPAYWADLSGVTLAEATAWASSNGVTLEVEYITPGDSAYDASLEGLVVDQSPRYGALVSEYKTGTVTIMGTGEIDESKYVPNFVGSSYGKVISWAEEYGVSYDITFDTTKSGSIGEVVSQSHAPYSLVSDISVFRVTVVAGQYTISFDKNNSLCPNSAPSSVTVTTGDDSERLTSMSDFTGSDGYDYEFVGWFTEKDGGSQITKTTDVSGDTTLYAHWEMSHDHTVDSNGWKVDTEPTCTEDGVKTGTCAVCGKTMTETISKLGHDYQVEDSKDATCTEDGYVTYKCSRCEDTYTETITASDCDVEEEEGS